MKYYPLFLLASSHFATAATVTVGAGSFSNFLNSSGAPLPVGSKVQIGFFLGIEVMKNGDDLQTNGPATFSKNQWDLFRPFDDTLFETFDGDGPGADNFNSVLNASYTFDADLVGGLSFPAYVGIRIFDTTSNDVSGAMFNTVARSVATWEFTDPSVSTNQPPSPNIPARDSIPAGTIFWEDNANPFETSLTPIPEPSTSLSALLGLGLLIGSRRR
jgi:hypothetical protein